MFGLGKKKKYKVKLSSGRILGPIDLKRIRKLIQKDQISGDELAREHPSGDWIKISLISEIADLLMTKLEGNLEGSASLSVHSGMDGATKILPDSQTVPLGETKILQPTQPIPTDLIIEKSETAKTAPVKRDKKHTSKQASETVEEEDSTMIATQLDRVRVGSETDNSEEPEEEATVVAGGDEGFNLNPDGPSLEVGSYDRRNLPIKAGVERRRRMAEMSTVVFSKKSTGLGSFGLSEEISSQAKKKLTPKDWVRVVLLASAIGYFGWETLLKDDDTKKGPLFALVEARLPFSSGTGNPEKSKQIYQAGLPFYVLDTIEGYRKAEKIFYEAAKLDSENVKAFAFLASTYLNLIELSKRDEGYFATIEKILDIVHTKALDLPETVIADIEYLVALNRFDAALGRVSEYAKTHTPDAAIFYYIAYIYFIKGDYTSAASQLSRISDDQAFSAKVFYLRGQVKEKFGEKDAAFQDYDRALKLQPSHAKSRVKKAKILYEKADFKSLTKEITQILEKPELLEPKSLAEAFFYKGMLQKSNKSFVKALADIELAVKLDRTNPAYLVELYSLRYQTGESGDKLSKEAKMYYHLGEGEKLALQGKYEEAKMQFFLAREQQPKSVLPLIKIGDMYVKLNDVVSALTNYRKAFELSSQNLEAAAKYIRTLIDSFEFERAKETMARFSGITGARSTMDRLMGDLFSKQKMYAEAYNSYRKALGRDLVDPETFIAFADSLVQLGKFKEAPYYYQLARRYDPANGRAVLGIARSLAESDGIDKSVRFLQDELQVSTAPKVELLVGLAEQYGRMREYPRALDLLNQAENLDPNYSYTYRARADIFSKKDEGTSQATRSLDQALIAFKSFSDRNPADPSGYLERYQIYIKKIEFDKAEGELDKVYALYPRYPNLHYFRGLLYGFKGNPQKAIEEFKKEIAAHPTNINAIMENGKEMLKLGAAQDALNEFNNAMKIAPQAAEPKHMAGYANFLLKNYEGAVVLYKAAIGIDGGTPVYYKRLGEVLKTVGDENGAQEAFRKYLEVAPDAPDRAEIQEYL